MKCPNSIFGRHRWGMWMNPGDWHDLPTMGMTSGARYHVVCKRCGTPWWKFHRDS